MARMGLRRLPAALALMLMLLAAPGAPLVLLLLTLPAGVTFRERTTSPAEPGSALTRSAANLSA